MGILNRRTVLGVLVAGAGAAALRPSVKGAPHNGYFQDLSAALNASGLGTPTLVIDLQRLRRNVDQVTRNIGGRMQLRIVAKSLPSLPLLQEVRKGAGTDRLMVFSLPQLLQLATPESDFLLGKPMPVAAAARFYRDTKALPQDGKLQWLIDTPERLAQYRDLARQQKRALAVNFEIDVGLHRGGIDRPEALAQMLTMVREEPLLQWRGLMGYDAHVTKIPEVAGAQQRAMAYARETYATYARMALDALGAAADKAVFNAAGSPTYRLYDGSGIENELSVGSAMVKGTDFDTPLLEDLQAAVYIATPVLKAPPQFQMPKGVEELGDVVKLWDRNQQQAYFIYGGNWLAEPESPAGLAGSGLYGTSSNQQVLVGSGLQGLKVDDWVFFRPRQSEAVLQQFGDIAVLDDGKISQFWRPMAATA